MFCDKSDKFECFAIKRGKYKNEILSLSISSCSLHLLFISSFSLHFLFISSFFLHFLAARLQGCNRLRNPDIMGVPNQKRFNL